MAIATNDGFSIGAKVPVDSRFFFDTVVDMAAYPENLIPSTYFCACNGALYIYSDSNTVDATTGKWRILNGSSVSISQATETVLGGIKAVSIDSSVDTTYTTEVKIDDTTGKLYVPFSASTSTNVFKDGFVESPQTDGTNWIYSDITFNIAQFKNYSDLIAQMTAYGSLFTIKEGMTVAVQEGETITTTDSDGNDVVTEYPFGLYRWNAVESKWDHQDYLLRDEFANHVEDSAKHVSTADRFNWDGKADGNFETTDIDVSSYLFKGQSKYIVDSAYLYTQLVNLKNKLDGNYANLYETLTDFKDHEDNKHTDVLHITAQEQSELHSHTNQTDILDNLGQDTNGNLTFNGLSVAGKKVVATKTDLGQVIVGDGIEVKSDGTIYIDWYSATDNGDGTSSVTIGSITYTKDNSTGDITGSAVGGVNISTTTTTDSSGNTIKVETIGDSTVTTTTAPDGSSTIVSEKGGVTTTTKKDSTGKTVSSTVGDVVVSGSVTETTITTSTDGDGNTVNETVTTIKTPTGSTQTTNTVVTKPSGESTETTTTVSSSGGDVNTGIATGETTVVEKDSSGKTTSTTTNPVLNKDGEDNLIHQDDLDYLFGEIEDLW